MSAPSWPRMPAVDYAFHFRPIRVVDGDTVDGIVQLPFDHTALVRVRLGRVNAPERYEDDGPRATLAVIHWIEKRSPDALRNRLDVPFDFTLYSVTNRGLYLPDVTSDKYRRCVGHIFHTESGELLNAYLVDHEFAEYTERWG